MKMRWNVGTFERLTFHALCYMFTVFSFFVVCAAALMVTALKISESANERISAPSRSVIGGRRVTDPPGASPPLNPPTLGGLALRSPLDDFHPW